MLAVAASQRSALRARFFFGQRFDCGSLAATASLGGIGWLMLIVAVALVGGFNLLFSLVFGMVDLLFLGRLNEAPTRTCLRYISCAFGFAVIAELFSS